MWLISDKFVHWWLTDGQKHRQSVAAYNVFVTPPPHLFA
jgi:hypothetical protein